MLGMGGWRPVTAVEFDLLFLSPCEAGVDWSTRSAILISVSTSLLGGL